MEDKDYFYTFDFYGFVYITTNLVNGKKYIGKRRFKEGWENYLGIGTLLRQEIREYGSKNFFKQIIEICRTEEVLNEREHYWITHFNAKDSEDFYNMTDKMSGRRSRILRIETDIVYEDVYEASKDTGVKPYSIEMSCSYKFYTVVDKDGKVAHFERYHGD